MKINIFYRSKSFIWLILAVFSLNIFVMGKSTFLTDSENDEFQIFQLINAERYKNRLENLEWNDELADVAREYSEKMADENFFEHTDFEGKTLFDRIREHGIRKWSKIGENLFVCRGIKNFSSFAVQNWMKSPSHQRNILDYDWTTTGIGIAKSGNGKIYITQVFISK